MEVADFLVGESGIVEEEGFEDKFPKFRDAEDGLACGGLVTVCEVGQTRGGPSVSRLLAVEDKTLTPCWALGRKWTLLGRLCRRVPCDVSMHCIASGGRRTVVVRTSSRRGAAYCQ